MKLFRSLAISSLFFFTMSLDIEAQAHAARSGISGKGKAPSRIGAYQKQIAAIEGFIAEETTRLQNQKSMSETIAGIKGMPHNTDAERAAKCKSINLAQDEIKKKQAEKKPVHPFDNFGSSFKTELAAQEKAVHAAAKGKGTPAQFCANIDNYAPK